MKKLLVINGSPRPDEISNTQKALTSYSNLLRDEKGFDCYQYFSLPKNLQGCMNCPHCVQRCCIDDKFKVILDGLESADAMLIGSPVYLDMPTAQTVAFLTRLNCMAESTNRKFFENKEAYILATSYCSGTKSVIHSIMGACEMLGFTIPGRGTREYIFLWKDKKIRGGMSKTIITV